MSYADDLVKDARLRMLQALARQTDTRLGDRMLEVELDSWGHRRSREWIRTQLRELAELGAVQIDVDNAATIVVSLTRRGAAHVARRGVIDGVLAPEPGE